MTQKFDLKTFDLPCEVDIPSRTQSVMHLTSQSIPGIRPDSVGLFQQRQASSVHSAHFRDSPEEEENLITCSETTIYGSFYFLSVICCQPWWDWVLDITVTTIRKGCADQLFGVSAHFKDSSYHKHRLLPRSTCNLVTICAFAQMTEHHVTKQKW